jgi:hypothetical protein
LTNNKRISEDVLEVLKEECKNDGIMERFLTDLIFEESNHPGNWWWKKEYNKYIEEYLSGWEENII